MNIHHIPGPAGELGNAPADTGQDGVRQADRFQLVEEHLAKGEVLQVVGITRGIAGEMSVLLRRDGDRTTRASMTRAAVRKVGPLRPGDAILMERDIHPITSNHFNPLQLFCIGSDACSRMGGVKDEEACEEAERAVSERVLHKARCPSDQVPIECDQASDAVHMGCIGGMEGVGGSQTGVLEERQLHGVKGMETKAVDARDLSDEGEERYEQEETEQREEEREELETTLCQETQPMSLKPSTTVASEEDRKGAYPGAGPTSTWHTHSRPHGSMNDDLYLAFTDSDDEGEVAGGGDTGVRIRQPSVPGPSQQAGVAHVVPKADQTVVVGRIDPVQTRPIAEIPAATPDTATGRGHDHQVDNVHQVDEVSEDDDDLLAGLDDPF